jgi:hypothetical protein
VTFVSSARRFDTNDTMGRMLPNRLLTFAQFEREPTLDRIRQHDSAGGVSPMEFETRCMQGTGRVSAERLPVRQSSLRALKARAVRTCRPG